MSGIAGCYMFNTSGNQEAISQATIASMLKELAVGNAHVHRSHSNKINFCIGISNSNQVNKAHMTENTRYVLCACGHFYNIRNIEEFTSAKSKKASGDSTADTLLKLYELKKEKIVDFLNGIYVVAVWEKKTHRLNIFTDRHGYEFLYYYQDASSFIFATEIKPILSQMKNKASVDIDALCDIFNFSSVYGNRTPLRQIRLLPHAAACSLSGKNYSIKQYWDYPTEIDHYSDNVSTLLTKAQKILQAAVEGALNGVVESGIMLSGGLDSRLLAAIAQSISSTRLKSFSFKFEDVLGNEHLYAQKIAEKLGIPFDYIHFSEKFSLADRVARTLQNCDGNWGFYEFIPYMSLIAEKHPGIFLINGFLLDTLFKSSWAFFPENDGANLTSALIAKRYTAIGEYILQMMFEADFYEKVKSRKIETVEETNANLPYSKPAEVSTRFYCLNRGRRSHNTILKAFQRHVNIILPGTDYQLTDFAFKLPYRLRSNPNFYLNLICSWFPGVASVPWDRTGKPLTVGVSEHSKSIRHKLFKFKYFIQRLSHGKLDFLNSSTSFNWMFRQNRAFREQVLDILLDPRSLSRGYYKQRNIEALTKGQMNGKDFSSAFKALISVEMMHRTFID